MRVVESTEIASDLQDEVRRLIDAGEADDDVRNAIVTAGVNLHIRLGLSVGLTPEKLGEMMQKTVVEAARLMLEISKRRAH